MSTATATILVASTELRQARLELKEGERGELINSFFKQRRAGRPLKVFVLGILGREEKKAMSDEIHRILSWCASSPNFSVAFDNPPPGENVVVFHPCQFEMV